MVGGWRHEIRELASSQFLFSLTVYHCLCLSQDCYRPTSDVCAPHAKRTYVICVWRGETASSLATLSQASRAQHLTDRVWLKRIASYALARNEIAKASELALLIPVFTYTRIYRCPGAWLYFVGLSEMIAICSALSSDELSHALRPELLLFAPFLPTLRAGLLLLLLKHACMCFVSAQPYQCAFSEASWLSEPLNSKHSNKRLTRLKFSSSILARVIRILNFSAAGSLTLTISAETPIAF